MASELRNLTEIASHLNVSTERARQVANADPTFLAPSSEHPRRWSSANIERWAERHWWSTRPWRKCRARLVDTVPVGTTT